MVGDTLLIVGNGGDVHVGRHLYQAALGLGLDVLMHDTDGASSTSLAYKVYGRIVRPSPHTAWRGFSQRLGTICHDYRPRWIIVTGLLPIESQILNDIGKLGVTRINFLTDDPWNPSHKARWFVKNALQYDTIYTPRKANIPDLTALGGPRIEYLPFGYAPDCHFDHGPLAPQEADAFDIDVAFLGGADSDRAPYIRALVDARFRTRVYGRYWKRYRGLGRHSRGVVTADIMRKVVRGAKLTLGCVRRANRDGHAMRSLEVPAMAGCLVAEDTEDHRSFFGDAVCDAIGFRSPRELVSRAKRLIDDPPSRKQLSIEMHNRIVTGRHTYADRLAAIIADHD